MNIEVRSEHKTASPEIQARIARTGGWNRLGEPNFRLVWGWSRLSLFGGKWEEWPLDDRGQVKSMAPIRVIYSYRWLPKYEPWFAWHVERWIPPEHFGTPASWYAATRSVEDGRTFYDLGPFPRRGEYEQCFPVIDPKNPKIPIELTPSLVDYIVAAIEFSRRVVHRDKAKALEALRRRESRREADWDQYADSVLDDAAPAFGGRPTSFPDPRPQPQP
jgi:hypothetical protein